MSYKSDRIELTLKDGETIELVRAFEVDLETGKPVVMADGWAVHGGRVASTEDVMVWADRNGVGVRMSVHVSRGVVPHGAAS